MRFSPWHDFLPHISLSAKGAPVAVQVQAIRAATIRLCSEARVWSHVSVASDLVAGEAKYAFPFPDMKAQVVGVNSFRLKGAPLAPSNKTEWPYGDESCGYPRIWREEEPGFVLLWPAPEEDLPGAIVVSVDLAPGPDSDECPHFLLAHYREAIKWGALAELVNVPDQAWANPNMAIGDYERRFRKEVARARIHENMGGTAGESLYVVPPSYFP